MVVSAALVLAAVGTVARAQRMPSITDVYNQPTATLELPPSDEPWVILDRIDRTLASASVLQYDVAVEAEGALAATVPRAWGTVQVSRDANGGATRVRVALSVERSDGSTAAAIVVSDGVTAMLLDPVRRIATLGADLDALGAAGRIARQGLLDDVAAAARSAVDDPAARAESLGRETVDGESCLRVFVAPESLGEHLYVLAAPDARWPRRIERVRASADGGVGLVRVGLADLRIDPPVDPSRFVVEPPADFRVVDAANAPAEPLERETTGNPGTR